MTPSSADTRWLDAAKLDALAAALAAAGYRVVAPVRDGQLTRLALWQAGQAVDLDHFAVNSAKEFLLPATEVIQKYSLDGNDFAPEDVAPDAAPTVLLAVRPCDAASMSLMDAVFNWDYEDLFYNARRLACTVVTLACAKADESCFCTSVGGAPDADTNADAVLSLADGGKKLTFTALTEKGQALASAAGALLAAGAAPAVPAAQVPVRFDVQAVTKWLADGFDSPLWGEMSLGCLSCGACAYACPSCHCFDIQDEATRSQAIRYRTWDACCIALFTKHTSGHNPRATAAARWRQRVMHKFSYIPQRFDRLGCTGCGRCTRLCPGGMTVAEACERIDQTCRSK